MYIFDQGGVLFAGTLKFLPLFLLVIPGMAARVLYKSVQFRIAQHSSTMTIVHGRQYYLKIMT